MAGALKLPEQDALLAATLLAVNPAGLNGASLRALSGPDRDAFTEALYASLVRRYSRGLLQYNDDTVKVLPHGGLIGLNEDFVTVKTVVMTNDGIAVPVDYRTRWDEGRWKVFDVKIEGLSYVTYYRDLIGDDVRRKGLDAVIADLRNS
mgnify:CR=1 FL=1